MKELLHNLSAEISLVGLCFFFFVVFIIITMWRWQKDPSVNFDIRDAFMKNKHVSRDAIFEWIGSLTFTFYMVTQIHNKVPIPETLWLTYGGLMIAKSMTNIIKQTPVTKETKEA